MSAASMIATKMLVQTMLPTMQPPTAVRAVVEHLEVVMLQLIAVAMALPLIWTAPMDASASAQIVTLAPIVPSPLVINDTTAIALTKITRTSSKPTLLKAMALQLSFRQSAWTCASRTSNALATNLTFDLVLLCAPCCGKMVKSLRKALHGPRLRAIHAGPARGHQEG